MAIGVVEENMAESEITLSAVEYLNTKPFIEGLARYKFKHNISISQDTPAQCSQKLSSGRADIGIVPVADFPQLKDFRKITCWGIAADGPVESVLLVANQPIEKLNHIYLDYQSRTSNKLMQILTDEFFQCNLGFKTSTPGYETNLGEGEGAVIIGDRALKSANKYACQYDLAYAWKQLTGLPFVFAIWVASNKVQPELEEELDQALGMFMNSRRQVADLYQTQFEQVDVFHYLTENIQYEITSRYMAGLELFWDKIHMLEGIY